MHDSEEKDFIHYEVSGMPLHWKLFNALRMQSTAVKPEARRRLLMLVVAILISGNYASTPHCPSAIKACFILLPKILLWLALVRSGVHYLMETAGIVDVVVNAMALTFVLQVAWLTQVKQCCVISCVAGSCFGRPCKLF